MDAFNLEELSALMKETLSTNISDPRREVDFQKLSAKIVAHCSILGIHLPSQNPFNSNSQLQPYDRNRNTDIDRLPKDVMQNVLSHLPKLRPQARGAGIKKLALGSPKSPEAP